MEEVIGDRAVSIVFLARDPFEARPMLLQQPDRADWSRIERLQRAGIDEDVDRSSLCRLHGPEKTDFRRRRCAIFPDEGHFVSCMRVHVPRMPGAATLHLPFRSIRLRRSAVPMWRSTTGSQLPLHEGGP